MIDTFLIFLVAVAALTLIILCFLPKKSPEPLPMKENYRPLKTGSYKIVNMLPVYNVEMTAIKGEDRKILHIGPKETLDVDRDFIENWLINGVRLEFRLYHGWYWQIHKKLWSTYDIKLPEGASLKNLYIGQITSRVVGSTADNAVGANAVAGRPWVRIHNLTQVPLVLNHGFKVEPMKNAKYLGVHHFGVNLGTIFHDRTLAQDGDHYYGGVSGNRIYPNFQMEVPVTDIYYGVISDIQQPLYGGWMGSKQLSPFTDEAEQPDDDPAEPHYLLYEGHY